MKNSSCIELFDGFALDLARCCLVRAGQPVHLRPQTYDVLKYLVENQGHLINKDKLIEEVWQGRAVTDSSLVKCIEEVREALGPGSPHYLRTVRGRGYIFDRSSDEEVSKPAFIASDQIDFVRITVEDHEEKDEFSPNLSFKTAHAVEARTVFRTVSLVVVVLAVVTVASVVAYRFFTRPVSNSAAIKSIAVLPFTNESGNQDIDYLTEGVSESLINQLAQLPGVKVIARTSSFKYNAKDDLQEAGRALGVEAILIGRVTLHGDNLLISAELVDARDKTHMWGDQYNRNSSDLLAVQSDISREIAETLRTRLTDGEHQQLAKRETVNPQAYELLLKGRFLRNKGKGNAIEFFNQAIATDPNYAAAYANLSLSYLSLVTASVLDPKEFIPKAETAARKALQLDDSLAEAHLAFAGTKLIAWDWASAERELRRAIDLNPNSAGARAFYSFYLSLRGRHDEAIAEMTRARELDPLSAGINAYLANRLMVARRYDQAFEAAERSIELDESRSGGHVQLGHVYAAKGQYREAIACFQDGIKLGDYSPDTQIYLGAAYAKGGERQKALAILKQLETRKEYVSSALAVLYVALGEREKALTLLERAYLEHDSQLQFLRIDPELDPLRSEPRFEELVRRVGV